jgi:phage shock protein E
MKLALWGWMLLLPLALLSGCATGISAQDSAKRIAKEPGLVLVDVRTPEEYKQGHLKDAKLIPVQELEARMAEIPKDKPVLLYCRSGHRSGIALKKLKEAGYTQVEHMAGGINAWKLTGRPLVQ